MACKCSHCKNPNCTCRCDDLLECECENCGTTSDLNLEVKGLNPSTLITCEGCSG